MKIPKKCFPVVLLIIGLSACAPSPPAATPTKTPIPATVAPTLAAGSVPSGQSDLSGVVLTPADVPPDVLPATPESLPPVAESFDQAPFYDVASVSGFTAARSQGPEIILAFGGFFTEDDPFREDAPAAQHPLFAVYMFIVSTGTQEIGDSGALTGLEGIGQEVYGYYGLANLNGQAIRVDMVVFRRGRAGVYVFHMYPQDWTPTASVVTLARILDARLRAALGGN